MRRSKGDQHVHLYVIQLCKLIPSDEYDRCIYLINPDTVISPSARRALGSFPNGSSTATLKNADGANPVADAQEEEIPQERMSMFASDMSPLERSTCYCSFRHVDR